MKRTTLLIAIFLAASPLVTQAATQQEIDFALAKIKNTADLHTVLNTPSALDALGNNLPQFINSIAYSLIDQKVTFNKEVLRSNLTATEIYNILVLFGQQTTISQYLGAAVITDTDRLLLTNSTLPFCNAAAPIDLFVTLDSNKQASFAYAQNGVHCDGNVQLTESTTVTYQLVHSDSSPKGLRLTGAGFANPFDGHVDIVTVSADGQTIELFNNIENTGVSKYQFIFSSDENDLLLLSPDPQIINDPS